MTRFTFAAAAFVALMGVAASADARPARIIMLQQTVPYRAVDLTTPQGAQQLLARVDGLALRMCRGNPTSACVRPVRTQLDACRAKAVARAVSELDAPLVTAAYAGRRDATLAAR